MKTMKMTRKAGLVMNVKVNNGQLLKPSLGRESGGWETKV